MSDALLLDTHIILWLESGDAKLRLSTRQMIDRRWREGATVLVSAVSAWEIAMLAESGRITLDCPAERWFERLLAQPGVEAAALSWRTSARAYDLRNLDHRDPADRLLIATAIEHECDFVTYDARIAAYAGGHGRQHGLRLAA